MNLLNRIRNCFAVGYLALASYAREPEPASPYSSGENPRTMQGEVLFEEEFEGGSLSSERWYDSANPNSSTPCESKYCQLKDGILEMTLTGTGIMSSLLFCSNWSQ